MMHVASPLKVFLDFHLQRCLFALGDEGFSRLSARQFFIMELKALTPSANLKGLHMQNAANNSATVADYFTQAHHNDINEMEVFGHLIAEILQAGMPVTNKAIISALISRLEQESDVIQLDIYRHLLEMVVNKTPDDFSV